MGYTSDYAQNALNGENNNRKEKKEKKESLKREKKQGIKEENRQIRTSKYIKKMQREDYREKIKRLKNK